VAHRCFYSHALKLLRELDIVKEHNVPPE
jgi:hypothetical protein